MHALLLLTCIYVHWAVNCTKRKRQEPDDDGCFIIDEVGTVFTEQTKLYSYQLCYFTCKKDDLTLENNIPKSKLS